MDNNWMLKNWYLRLCHYKNMAINIYGNDYIVYDYIRLMDETTYYLTDREKMNHIFHIMFDGSGKIIDTNIEQNKWYKITI